MNPIIRKALYAIVILAIVALLILSFQKNFEYVEKTQWQPLVGEAKTNPLYASKLFLRRMGIPTKTIESLHNLTTLPSTDSAVLISTSRQVLRPEQFDNLLNWVRDGGHLIISGVIDSPPLSESSTLVDEPDNSEGEEPAYEGESDEAFTSTADPLQDFLNVKIRGYDTRFDEDNQYETIKISGSEHPLELVSGDYHTILLNAENKKIGLEQIAINDKNFIIRQQVDEGLITLVSDFDFIDNYQLGEYDHAELLWQIVRGKSVTTGQSDLLLPEAVWLIHSDEATTLFEIIWKRFWVLLITLALLLFLWVLRVSRRFGPLIPKQAEDRRNLLEHIDASGTYYWKQNNHEGLLESTRSATQQQLAKRIPGWHALSQQDQIQQLAKRLDTNEPLLLQTLYGNIRANAYEFTETIKQLEHIRTHV